MSRIIIYLGLPLPASSSDLPKGTTGRRIAFYAVLLRMGFTWLALLPGQRWSLTHAFPPLPVKPAVYFCCTFLRVTPTGRYPASCPAKPGLSSPAASQKEYGQPRLFILLIFLSILYLFSSTLASAKSMKKSHSAGQI